MRGSLGFWIVSDTQTELDVRERTARHQIRRRALPAARRGEFDRLLLAGEDICRLARRFGIEPWYAKRRATRVLAQTVETREPAPRTPVLPMPDDDTTPTEYACRLLGARVDVRPNGYYRLDGVHAGPRELIRATNQILRARGMKEFAYPGLQSLQR
jgi:hypothetical protein